MVGTDRNSGVSHIQIAESEEVLGEVKPDHFRCSQLFDSAKLSLMGNWSRLNSKENDDFLMT